MKVIINGAGIAGPALAYWLRRGGHDVVLVEAAPKLRTGGYVVDFWGVGYDIADKMGNGSTWKQKLTQRRKENLNATREGGLRQFSVASLCLGVSLFPSTGGEPKSPSKCLRGTPFGVAAERATTCHPVPLAWTFAMPS